MAQEINRSLFRKLLMTITWIISANLVIAIYTTVLPSSPQNWSVDVGAVASTYWYRLTPAVPNSIENCVAATNGNYARLSLNPGGPFSPSIDVPFPSDGSGYGHTPSIYIKGVAPYYGLEVNLLCPLTTNNPSVWDILPAATPTPTPTPAPPAPTAQIKKNWSRIAVGSVDNFYVEIDNGPTFEFSASYSVCAIAEWQTETRYPVGFSHSPYGPFSTCIAVPFSTDAEGDGASSTVYVKGLKDTADVGSTQIYSSGYSSQSGRLMPNLQASTIRVVNVASVSFATYTSCGNVPLNINPNTGGGFRIYPDKLDPRETTDTEYCRRRVRVIARLTEPLAGITVHFKDFDVDDPSSDEAPLDPNGTSGGDNKDESAAHLYGGTTAVTNSSGEAATILRVTRAPGDNFKVAATANANVGYATNSFLDVIQVQGTNLYDNRNNVVPDANTLDSQRLAPAKSTLMLTVWRRLHIERDSMGLVTGNFASGTVTKVVTTVSPFFPFTTTSVLTLSRSIENERFEKGRLKFAHPIDGTDSFRVLSNTKRNVTVTGEVPQAFTGQAFVLYDDDDFNANDGLNQDSDEGEEIPDPDMSLLQDSDDPNLNRLARAYVRPTYDLAHHEEDDVQFAANSPTVVDSDGTILSNPIALFSFGAYAHEDNPDFWTVYVLNGYQDFTPDDCDPRNAGDIGALARISDFPNGHGAIVFLEAIAEYHRYLSLQGLPVPDQARANAIIAHEIGHLFGAHEGEQGLMDARCSEGSEVCTNYGTITLNTIRSANSP